MEQSFKEKENHVERLLTSLASISDVSPSIDRNVWLEAKKSTIGASESSIVLGLTGSILKLYLQKTGQLEPEEPTEAMNWGIRLEPLIAQAFEEKTGRKIAATQVFRRHPTMPWLSATVDAITESGDLVEFKSVGLHGAGRQLGEDEDNETVPDSWTVQDHQQMLVFDRPVVFMCVFGPGLRIRNFTVRRHKAVVEDKKSLEEIIEEKVGNFWHQNVLAEVPPEDYVAEDAVTLAKAFRKQSGEWLSLGPDLLHSAQNFEAIKAEIKRLENAQAVEKARLLGSLGNAVGADLPGGWSLHRKVLEVNYKAREAYTDSQVRFSVKEPRC